MVTCRSILTATLAVLALFLVSPVLAAADPASDCAVTVVDTTDDHLFDVERLTAAANDMGHRTGLDVYVRTFQTTPHGDAGVWWRDAYKNCPALLATDGVTPKPNILVVAVGMDRKSAIEYGEAVTKLDGDIDRIRGRVLGDALRDANAAPADDQREAFTAAIETTLAELEAAYTKPPFDWGNVWAWVLKVLLAIAGVVASVFWFFLSRTGIRKHRAKVKLRAEMKEARDESTNAVVNAEATLRQHFIEADDAMSRVEGEYIALPSQKSITKRVNAASASHFGQANNPTPKSIDALTRARDAYRRYAKDIGRALDDAEKRTADVRSRVAQCTPESKDRDLRAASVAGADRLAALRTEAPVWLSATTLAAVLSVAVQEADALVGTVPPRPTVDTATEAVRSACTAIDLMVTGAERAGKRVLTLRSDATSRLSTYTASPPEDVSVATVESTRTALEKLVPKVTELADAVISPRAPMETVFIESRTSELRAELNEALRQAEAEIAAAQVARDKEKRVRYEEERRKSREREEADRSSRSSSYGGGFNAGYAAGGFSSGGFSSGGDGGGGGYGGGSSGSW